MPNAAMVAIPGFIELGSKLRMDNQSTQSEAVMEYPERSSDEGLFRKPNSCTSLRTDYGGWESTVCAKLAWPRI